MENFGFIEMDLDTKYSNFANYMSTNSHSSFSSLFHYGLVSGFRLVE